MLTQRPTPTTQWLPTISSRSSLQEEEEWRPTATGRQPPIILRRSSPQEEEEQRTTAATPQLPTISRRPSPYEVQPLTIYPQQVHTALFKKLGRDPRSWRNPM